MENLDIKAFEVIEKSRGAQIGEVRTWGGKEYIKTPKGWRLKLKGYKEGEKKQELTEAGNPVGKSESVTPRKVTDQLKVGDRVMYNGKEMTLTRISKDGRFQNGIEMKFVNEGDSTQTGGKTLLGNMMYAKPVKEKGPAAAANKLEGGEKELELFDKDGGQLNVRVYKDGGVKVEGLNVRKDFDNTTEAWNFLVRNGYTRSEEELEFPKKIDIGTEATVKVNGKEYIVKHQYNKDDKYGKYRVYENGKQIMISDYGAGSKFHGYDFDRSDKAYEGVKRFLKTGKLK